MSTFQLIQNHLKGEEIKGVCHQIRTREGIVKDLLRFGYQKMRNGVDKTGEREIKLLLLRIRVKTKFIIPKVKTMNYYTYSLWFH